LETWELWYFGTWELRDLGTWRLRNLGTLELRNLARLKLPPIFAQPHLTIFPMSQPIILAFANQKGGVGKSTLSTHIASALRYIYGYKVAMADFDYPQNSLVSYRRKDETLLKSDDKVLERAVKQNIAPYPIIESSVENSNADLVALQDGGYDFILVDTPGTVNLDGLPELVKSLDYIFLPMESDSGSVASTVGYMNTLQNYLQSKVPSSNLLSFHAFWNRYVKAERKAPYKEIAAYFKHNNLSLLNTRVESLVTYRDNRSTIFSLPERDLQRLGLGKLIMEMLCIVIGEGQVTPSGAKITFQPDTSYDQVPSNSSPVEEAGVNQEKAS
jgi:cellulose biosynthesis protein BcsQ